MIRLDKFLALKGVCTRSQVPSVLKKHEVMLNGIRLKKKDIKLSEGEIVVFDLINLEYKKNRYFILNKPLDVVSATSDDLHETVVELLYTEDFQTDIFPVGRLDIDTTGLLILTNDGKLAHDMISPKKKIDKVYEVVIEHPLSDEDIHELENGVFIHEDYLTKPATVKVIDECLIHLTISEGKYHQVKEMLKAVFNEVIKLNRIKIGTLDLPENISVGEYIEVDEQLLRDAIK